MLKEYDDLKEKIINSNKKTLSYIHVVLFFKCRKNTESKNPKAVDYSIFNLAAENLKPYLATLLLFFASHNMFFHTQVAFVFHLLKDSYIVHGHILAFYLFLLR